MTLSLFLAVFYCAHFGSRLLAASGRQADYDRQLLAHPPVSAEPAGAVSGCRYGPMREKTGLAATVPVAPPLSRRDLRSCTPDGV
ncbi:hypothetical protein E0I04_025725 [Escherichia coli]|nr:hypothetical protein [Escherichia coli]